jgi:hypothetical protein
LCERPAPCHSLVQVIVLAKQDPVAPTSPRSDAP